MSSESQSKSSSSKISAEMGSSHNQNQSSSKKRSSKSHGSSSQSRQPPSSSALASHGQHRHLSSSSGMYGAPSSHAAGPSGGLELPSSVRNAPPELRTSIRRKQNNESAKRSRERKRAEEAEMRRKMEENDVRIQHLEKEVETLTAALLNDVDPADGRSGRRNPPSSPSTKPGFYGDPF